MEIRNSPTRPQLGDSTSGRPGAGLIGTVAKVNLGNATDVESALLALDANTAAAPDAFGFVNWSGQRGDPFEIRSNYGNTITRVDDIIYVDNDSDLTGVDWRQAPGDPFEIRSNYGLTVTRNGDIYYLDWLVGGSGLTISGGQGITVVVSGSDYTVHQREPRTLETDGTTVTLDCANDNNFRLNMSASPGNRTLAVSNVSAGQKFSMLLKNGGSNTVTWWSGIIWPGGGAPTLTSTANHGDLIAFECLAAGVYLGFIVAQDLDLTGV
jgi:hypothetical protein